MNLPNLSQLKHYASLASRAMLGIGIAVLGISTTLYFVGLAPFGFVTSGFLIALAGYCSKRLIGGD